MMALQFSSVRFSVGKNWNESKMKISFIIIFVRFVACHSVSFFDMDGHVATVRINVINWNNIFVFLDFWFSFCSAQMPFQWTEKRVKRNVDEYSEIFANLAWKNIKNQQNRIKIKQNTKGRINNDGKYECLYWYYWLTWY